jgi:hypothetical protein
LQERAVQEIAVLKEKYPNLEHGGNYDWVMIPDFPLPNGYNRKNTKLLFLIPLTYPHVAPDCFYVEVGLRLVNGNFPSNYNEHMNVPVGGSWGYFSWHPEIWRPVDDYHKADNLVSFIKAVNLRLREAD